MEAGQNKRAITFKACLPILFGCAGLLLCAIYQSQRSGLLFHYLSGFIQHHLDAFAGAASLAGLVGILVGLFMRRFKTDSKLVAYGIVVSLVSLLWSNFGLSL